MMGVLDVGYVSPSNATSSPYVQPLPSELDPKSSPLAMLVKACGKIESDMMKSSGTSLNSCTSRASSIVNKSVSPIASTKTLSSPETFNTSSEDLYMKSFTPKKTSSKKSSSPAISPSAVSLPERTHLLSSPVLDPSALSSYSMYANFLASPAFPPHMDAAKPPCVDPACNDPTCPMAFRKAQLLGALGVGAFPPIYSPAAMAAYAAATASSPLRCDWMLSSGTACGQRFSTTEELQLHLRNAHTATTSAADATALATAIQMAQTHAALYPFSGAALAALQVQAATQLSKTSSTPVETSEASSSALPTSRSGTSAFSSRYTPYSRPSMAVNALIPPTPNPYSTLPPHLAGLVNPYFPSPYSPIPPPPHLLYP